MIENRFRLEKQILLGRQAVRRSMQSKPKPPLADFHITRETDAHEPGTSVVTSAPPEPTGSDHPLSPDTNTDTDLAAAEGIHAALRNEESPSSSGVATPHADREHPRPLHIRASLFRRKQASKPANASNKDDPHLSPGAQQYMSVDRSSKQASSVTSPKGFFNRLRSKSLSTLKAPFSPLSRVSLLSTPQNADETARKAVKVWSSESSSEDSHLMDDHHDIRTRLSNNNTPDCLEDGEDVDK
jgi:hypothetical protein